MLSLWEPLLKWRFLVIKRPKAVGTSKRVFRGIYGPIWDIFSVTRVRHFRAQGGKVGPGPNECQIRGQGIERVRMVYSLWGLRDNVEKAHSYKMMSLLLIRGSRLSSVLATTHRGGERRQRAAPAEELLFCVSLFDCSPLMRNSR